ncbi:MAG: hypothetical protein ACTSUP_01180 [Candidatus Heimdallarchaeaceae archaeon]
MRVKSIKNTSSKRISVLTSNGMEISLPPNESYGDKLDVTNLKDIEEKVSYVADLTEVGKSSTGLQKLND